MRRLLATVLLCLAVFSLSSCDSRENEITSVNAQPFVDLEGDMGLSVYAIVTRDDADLRMVVTDPSGSLTWEFDANRVSLGSVTWFGSSDLMMPSGVDLPCGNWCLDVITPDGKRKSQTFDVSYSKTGYDIDGQRSQNEGPFLDEASGLVFMN